MVKRLTTATFGGAISVLGIAFFGLPAGILAAGFIEESQRQGYRNANICPHCGQRPDELAEGGDGDRPPGQ